MVYDFAGASVIYKKNFKVKFRVEICLILLCAEKWPNMASSLKLKFWEPHLISAIVRLQMRAFGSEKPLPVTNRELNPTSHYQAPLVYFGTSNLEFNAFVVKR